MQRARTPSMASGGHASGFCDRCHLAITPSNGELAESYVVLDQRRPASDDSPTHSLQTRGKTGGSITAATMDETLRTVSRLLELSELPQNRMPDAPCSVPLCEECAQAVLDELQQRLARAHQEREMLQAAFAELEAGDDDADDEPALSEADFEREQEAQRAKEDELRAEIAAAKAERVALRDEVQRLEQQRMQQDAEEEAQHAALNAAELERQAASEEGLRASQLVAHCEREIRRLERVDVLSDLFHVDIEGAVGSINGLRLGRFSAVHVEWTELNAALGQVVLLVVILARLHGVTFRAHVLVPHGSYSKVYTAAKVAYELHGSGAANLGRLFGTGRFEKALGMLIVCIGELCDHAAARPRAGVAAMPPHPVNELSSSFIGSASEGKKLLSDLAWCLRWHAASNAPGL